ncbi:translation factor SUA5 [Litoreibacter ascidiaceicola]|uniref:Threonylcarbamoyl-AMP synthase n=1 Tax=Litoreibacter ascidiaceicola TaxID=1486859 RepID=A0A1M5CB48_9RHOB|nr:L-threonylcarbamoyladenylate synthase [Litoreibacter ascidiaceicola]SHF51983.1 translation factor SUA5 [Litoreibacter ascidiaceicola]
MTDLDTLLLGPADLAKVAKMLQSGQLVAFPTETVYGLGADARNGSAVAAIYAAKGRPSFNPLIVHVASMEQAEALAHFDHDARALAQAFWPGPLSLVLPLKDGHGLSSLVTAGLDTVAIRMPAQLLARDLLALADCPVAAPSANPSGQISPTTAAHVLAGLSGRIDAVLDGGPCKVGVESTIVATSPLRLLRPGGLPVEALNAALGSPLAEDTNPDTPSAPGQLVSHYAPNARVALNQTDGAFMLGFGAVNGQLNLSPSGDLHEAAANLFAMLRQMDELASDTDTIRVAPIPMTGLGLAINDRLTRAAAPRLG